MGGAGPKMGRTNRLNEQVLAEMRRRIVLGRLTPGEHVTEISIASELGVSRTPVRHALRVLKQTGALVARGNGGLVVAEISDDTASLAASEIATPINHAATWEGIYDQLSRKLVARAAFGNWRIVETELAGFYDVSRTVAREVLARLEHIGIIHKERASRWILPALTSRRITQLYEMRWLLEPIALRKAGRMAPRQLLVDMRDELKEVIESPGHAVSASELDRLEQRLHIELLSYGENLVLLDTLQNFHALLVTNAELYHDTQFAIGVDPFVGEHLAVIESVLAGKHDQAARQLEQHLKTATQRVNSRIADLVAKTTLEPLPFLKPVPGDQAVDPPSAT